MMPTSSFANAEEATEEPDAFAVPELFDEIVKRDFPLDFYEFDGSDLTYTLTDSGSA